jgi:predicted transcriptional regulator of viral defense system
VFVDDPRASLCIDDVQILLYFILPPAEQSSAPSRESLTQLLSHTVKQGWLRRVSRGRYAVTEAGRAQLLEWLT